MLKFKQQVDLNIDSADIETVGKLFGLRERLIREEFEELQVGLDRFMLDTDRTDPVERDQSKIEIPENYILKSGNNIPERALTNWSELRAYSGIPEQGPLDEETAKLMIHGYYASVSFVDAQIGRLLKTLEEEGLDKNTTVVLIGDHGWNLGEHGT